jgi:hypothetical protein
LFSSGKTEVIPICRGFTSVPFSVGADWCFGDASQSTTRAILGECGNKGEVILGLPPFFKKSFKPAPGGEAVSPQPRSALGFTETLLLVRGEDYERNTRSLFPFAEGRGNKEAPSNK